MASAGRQTYPARNYNYGTHPPAQAVLLVPRKVSFPPPRPLKVKGDGYASQVSNCKTVLTCQEKERALGFTKNVKPSPGLEDK